MKFAYTGATHRGFARKTNQDDYYVNSDQNYLLLADGIGGSKGGAEAASCTIHNIKENYKSIEFFEILQLKQCVLSALDQSSNQIYCWGLENKEFKNSGTTFEGFFIYNDQGVIVHLGDSSTFLFEKDTLWQLSLAHNLNTELQRKGKAGAQLFSRQEKSSLTRFVGMADSCQPDLMQISLHPGMIFLLCSDGLTDMIANTQIQSILRLKLSLEKTADTLIQAALSSGGKDNITVILCKIY